MEIPCYLTEITIPDTLAILPCISLDVHKDTYIICHNRLCKKHVLHTKIHFQCEKEKAPWELCALAFSPNF